MHDDDTRSAPHGPDDTALLRPRVELERHAAILFLAAALTMAIVCGAVIVSGWFAGVLVDRWERLFCVVGLVGDFYRL
jgi:hypothetical protein